MRVAFNCHTLIPPFTGVQRSVAGMVRAVCRQAPEEEFLAYVPRNWRDGAGLAAPNLAFRRSWIGAGNRTLRIAWEQFVLHARVFRDGVDILHAPCYVMPVWCLKPTVVTVHDLFALTHPLFCRKGNAVHYARMLPKTVERAARIVTPTSAVKRELIDRFQSLRADKIRVIPWGVDERFRPVEEETKRGEVALRYGLPPRYVLHVGRREPKKNLPQAVQAFFAAMVNKRLPHRLVLAGPQGWGVPKFDRFIRDHGLEEKVLRIGYVDDEDLPALYSMADALLFPSLAEGFGLPVLEAMACGTPVVATGIPALKEVAGGGALFAPPGELPALRAALEAVLTDGETARRLSEAGRARAAEFSWTRHAEALCRLYREVYEEDRAGRGV